LGSDLAVKETTVYSYYFVIVSRTPVIVSNVRFCTAVLKKVLGSSYNQTYVQKLVSEYVQCWFQFMVSENVMGPLS